MEEPPPFHRGSTKVHLHIPAKVFCCIERLKILKKTGSAMIFVARQKTKGEPADLLAVQCPWG